MVFVSQVLTRPYRPPENSSMKKLIKQVTYFCDGIHRLRVLAEDDGDVMYVIQESQD